MFITLWRLLVLDVACSVLPYVASSPLPSLFSAFLLLFLRSLLFLLLPPQLLSLLSLLCLFDHYTKLRKRASQKFSTLCELFLFFYLTIFDFHLTFLSLSMPYFNRIPSNNRITDISFFALRKSILHSFKPSETCQ